MYRLTFAATIAWFFAISPSEARDADGTSCSLADFEEARFVFHRAWFEEADELFDGYLAGCPDDSLAHAYAAIIDMLLYRDGSSHANRALQDVHSLDDTNALFVRALVHFSNGELEETEVHLRRFLRRKRGDTYALHFLGFTLNDQGKHDEGVTVLEELLTSEPDYFPAMNHLAYGLLRIGNEESAVRIAGEFVEADPGNPSAWDTQADILNSLKRSEEAIASLSRSLLLDHRFAYGYRHIGDILSSLGNREAALAAYRSALSSASAYGEEFAMSVHERLARMDMELRN